MSDIIIKGMGMLPEGFAYEVIIRGNGDVLDAETGMKMGTAADFPQHGDLGDISDLYANLMADIQTSKIVNLQDVIRIINEKFENAPVILKTNYKEG